MAFVCFNGAFHPADEPVLTAQNRSFKFGDGLFETMRMQEGGIPLVPWHQQRLFRSMDLLKMTLPSEKDWQNWQEQMVVLCQKNGCLERGRIRLTLCRTIDGWAYCMEAVPLNQDYLRWKEEGELINVYPEARKAIDSFANIKSCNYLPYTMASLFAQEKGLDDCLLLNTEGNVCDSTKANVFAVKEDNILTPALHQGCIQGVMRQWLIETLAEKGHTVQEAALSQADLLQADEIFLTNALYGIRWVRKMGARSFGCQFSRHLYTALLPTIFG
jgi:branched-chain amino acid aminotransferase